MTHTWLNLVAHIKLHYNTANHQTVHHSIAVSVHVGVNTIISKMFLKSLMFNHNATAGIVKAKLLSSAPFPVTDIFLQDYDSNNEVTKSSPSLNPNYASIVSKLDDLFLIILHQSDCVMVILQCTQPVHTILRQITSCTSAHALWVILIVLILEITDE